MHPYDFWHIVESWREAPSDTSNGMIITPIPYHCNGCKSYNIFWCETAWSGHWNMGFKNQPSSSLQELGKRQFKLPLSHLLGQVHLKYIWDLNLLNSHFSFRML